MQSNNELKLSDGNPKLKAKDFSITPSNKNI